MIAGGLSGCAEERPALVCVSRTALPLSDAISLMSYAVRQSDADVEMPALIAAGATLLAHVREQQRELERERARWGRRARTKARGESGRRRLNRGH